MFPSIHESLLYLRAWIKHQLHLLDQLITGALVRNSQSAALLCAVALVLSAAPASAADTYHGNWGGNAPTSLTITRSSPLQVRYCFRGRCEAHEPSGTVNRMAIRYPRRNDFPGATLTFQKRGNAYEGRYQIRNATQVHRAMLTKR